MASQPLTGAERNERSDQALCEARGRVTLLMLRRLGDRELAEDVVQTALLECLETARHRPEALRNPGGMLFTVAKRRSVDLIRLRGRERKRRLRDDVTALRDRLATQESHPLVNKERVRAIMESLPRLPEAEREVLRLRFFEELPPREVAEKLGIPPAQVSRLQWRALDKLRQMLDDGEPRFTR